MAAAHPRVGGRRGDIGPVKERERKHCWETAGDPTQKFGPDGRRRRVRKYKCRTCGASFDMEVRTGASRRKVGASGKIPASEWIKAGIKSCDMETVLRVHEERVEETEPY